MKQQTSVFFNNELKRKAWEYYYDRTGCENNCRVVSSIQYADALVSLHAPLQKASNKQITVQFSRESLAMQGKNIAKFDFTTDICPLSNVPITRIPANFWQTMHDMSIPTKENLKKRKLAVWYGHNCDNTEWPRTQYLKELSQYMQIYIPWKMFE